MKNIKLVPTCHGELACTEHSRSVEPRHCEAQPAPNSFRGSNLLNPLHHSLITDYRILITDYRSLITATAYCLLLTAYCYCLLPAAAFSQDLHFSQYCASPLTMNPALAGTFNGDIRGILSYRDQWNKLDNAYKTYAFNCDAQIYKQRTNTGFLGGGISFFYDLAGASGLATTLANISVSYHLKFNKENLFTVGLQGGILQQKINDSHFQWDSQYDGYNYNPTLASNENINKNGYIVPDISLGGVWNYRSKRVKDLNDNNGFKSELGLAVFHVTKPEYSFYNSTKDNINARFVAHGNAAIGINTVIAFVPSFVYMKQGESTEMILGSAVRLMTKEASTAKGIIREGALSLGGYYRFKDAFIASILFESKNFSIGFSYDINTSDLKLATNKNGGPEVTLRYTTPSPFSYRRKGNSLL
ncbi:MAG: PorP/SprF family type IX secretion system membrane protein [Bacteroidia bacterium]|nr:PorP/SprF family type IX secretion system membrane protein [Bacteroidia bacterium]